MITRPIKSFEDLMRGHTTATISCLYTRNLVRTLTLIGLDVRIDPNGPEKPNEHPIICVPVFTPIHYEPWEMDRGSLVFEHPDFKPFAKLCGEGDPIHFTDTDTYEVISLAVGIKRVPHEVRMATEEEKRPERRP